MRGSAEMRAKRKGKIWAVMLKKSPDGVQVPVYIVIGMGLVDDFDAPYIGLPD